MALLKSENLIFTVSGVNRDNFSSHALQLDGRILTNGVLSVKTTETNTTLSSLDRGIYPVEFEGVMNSLGRLKLQMTQSCCPLFGGRVPSKFQGTISNTGFVRLNVLKSHFEFSGRNFISNLICTPFRKEPGKRDLFITNRRILTSKIKELRNRILYNRPL